MTNVTTPIFAMLPRFHKIVCLHKNRIWVKPFHDCAIMPNNAAILLKNFPKISSPLPYLPAISKTTKEKSGKRIT